MGGRSRRPFRWIIPVVIAGIPAGCAVSLGEGTVYAYEVDHGLVRKAAGSEVFETVGPALGDDAILHLAVKEGEMAATTYKGAMLRSADGGRAWTPLVNRDDSGR